MFDIGEHGVANVLRQWESRLASTFAFDKVDITMVLLMITNATNRMILVKPCWDNVPIWDTFVSAWDTFVSIWDTRY